MNKLYNNRSLKAVLNSFTAQFILVFLIGILVLYPTFDLALTGDDYLGYWRITQFVKGGGGYLEHFFRDYGSQDLLTFAIHFFVGFNSRYYYLLAFILRVLASLSFYPIVISLTKNKTSAFFSAIFFLVSATGMEILDWSFNMPSYIGIAFMNLSLFYLLKSFNQKYLKSITPSLIFFLLAIISQPLRLLVLPVIFPFILLFVFLVSKKDRLKTIASFLFFIVSFSILFSLTNYGLVSGVVSSNSQEGSRVTGIFQNISLNISQAVKDKGYKVLLNPIGQIGIATFSTSATPEELRSLSNLGKIILIALMYLSFSLILLYTKRVLKINPSKLRIITWGVLIWSTLATFLYLPQLNIYLHTYEFVGFFLGGYFLIFILILLATSYSKQKDAFIGFVTSFAIIGLSFLPSFIRDPAVIQPSFNRYFVVSAAGTSIFIGTLYKLFQKKRVAFLSIFIFIFLNAFETTKFVRHLHTSRNIKLADAVRNSLPLIPELGYTEEPTIFYLEGDNSDILYHSVYFGFPFFLNYYKNEMKNPWGFAYTRDWKEIIEAYQTGESLKRHATVKIRPVKLENIYSLRLQGDILIDTSEETRDRILESEKANSAP